MTAVFCLTLDFGKISTITLWARRKCIGIIIEADKLPTFIAPIRSFAGFLSCCWHIISPIFKDGFTISFISVKSTITTNTDTISQNSIKIDKLFCGKFCLKLPLRFFVQNASAECGEEIRFQLRRRLNLPNQQERIQKIEQDEFSHRVFVAN